MWLLVIDSGEVWLDSRSSDHTVRRVAPSFHHWYRDWIASCVRNVPWIQWDASTCATPASLSSLMDEIAKDGFTGDASLLEAVKRLEGATLAIANIGSSYFPPNAALDPCHACVTLMVRFGASQDIFVRGVPPLQ